MSLAHCNVRIDHILDRIQDNEVVTAPFFLWIFWYTRGSQCKKHCITARERESQTHACGVGKTVQELIGGKEKINRKADTYAIHNSAPSALLSGCGEVSCASNASSSRIAYRW